MSMLFPCNYAIHRDYFSPLIMRVISYSKLNGAYIVKNTIQYDTIQITFLTSM